MLVIYIWQQGPPTSLGALIHPSISCWDFFAVDHRNGPTDMQTEIPIPRATLKLALAKYTKEYNETLRAEGLWMYQTAQQRITFKKFKSEVLTSEKWFKLETRLICYAFFGLQSRGGTCLSSWLCTLTATAWTCSNDAYKQTLVVTNHPPRTLTAGVRIGAVVSSLPDSELSLVITLSWDIEHRSNLLMQLSGIIRVSCKVEGKVSSIWERCDWMHAWFIHSLYKMFSFHWIHAVKHGLWMIPIYAQVYHQVFTILVFCLYSCCFMLFLLKFAPLESDAAQQAGWQAAGRVLILYWVQPETH